LPDVYQGAPTCVTLFIGTAPKLAAFALVVRILVEGMGSAALSWEAMLGVMAILSLGIGNVVAIVQTNVKRMLAYSAIGHVGFIFLGFFDRHSRRSRSLSFLYDRLCDYGRRRLWCHNSDESERF